MEDKQIDIEDLQVKNIRYENIEIGDYVRFIDYDFLNTGKEKTVKIGKIKCKYSDIIEIELNNNLSKIVKTTINEILKVKKNIIDLIEEGDYVNGDEVIVVYGYDEDGNDKDKLGICQVDDDYAYYLYLEDIDIKSIATKEQFAQVQYKVGE